MVIREIIALRYLLQFLRLISFHLVAFMSGVIITIGIMHARCGMLIVLLIVC